MTNGPNHGPHNYTSISSGLGGGLGGYITGTPTSGQLPQSGLAGNITATQGVWTGGNYTVYQTLQTPGSSTPYQSNVRATELEDRREIDLRGKPAKIVTDEGEIDLGLLAIMFREMKSIMCLIREDQERLEKYPSLKAAFDQYELIEAIVRSEDDNEEE